MFRVEHFFNSKIRGAFEPREEGPARQLHRFAI